MPQRPPIHLPPGAGTPRQQRARYDQERGSREERGYDAAWRRFRLHVLAGNALCSDCAQTGLLTRATRCITSSGCGSA